jgi:four helix bundle protein
MAIKSFRDLDAWRVAMDMAVCVYDIAGRLPQSERFEMASQMRRAAVSVPSNIAEGHAFRLSGRNRHHVRMALGSVAELSTCANLGNRLGYFDNDTHQELEERLTRTSQVLHGLLRSIRVQLAARDQRPDDATT